MSRALAMAPTAAAVPCPPEPPEIGLIVACVAARAARRLAWLEATDAAGDADAERVWQAETGEGRRHQAAVDDADAALARRPESRLGQLVRLFALGPAERDILLVALALRLEPELAQTYQRLTGRPWATEPLAQRLFGHGRRPIWDPTGPLAAWGLVAAEAAAPGEPPPLVADPVAAFWMAGETHIDAELRDHVALLEPPPPLDEAAVAAAADAVRAHWAEDRPVRLIVAGAAGSGRASFAAAVASKLGLKALDVATLPAGADWPRLWMLVQRQAIVAGAMPVWRPATLPWPRGPRPAPVQAVTVEPGAAAPDEPVAATVAVAPPAPDVDARLALLGRLVPESAAWPAPDRRRLAARPGVAVGDLARLARSGVSGPVAAEAMLREAAAGRLGDVAERLDTGFDWDDLVLPAPLLESLRDLAFEAEHRAAFWERAPVRRLFGRGRGLAALFAGPPGTGKTMAAQVVARAIGVDVLRIDLATLISKYIGETAKNLKQVFARAAGQHALLLFDEADALFANRTEVKDAHDRYANADTGYLLQQLESFDGIAVLATNRKAAIDPAFIRRLRYVFDFPRPEAAERRLLWRALAPPILGVTPDDALAATLDRLGTGLELSGAQIKTALVAGHFAARRRGAVPPGLPDLVRGIERELAKEGRVLTPRDRQRLVGDG